MGDREPQSFPFVSTTPVLRPTRLPPWGMPFWLLVTLAFSLVLMIPGGLAKLVAACVAIVGLTVFQLESSPGRPVRSRVRAGEQGLEIDGRLVPRARIVDGFLLRDPVRVHLRLRFGITAEVYVGNVKEGRALLRALGLGVSQTVAEFDTLTPSRWRHLGGPLAFLVLVPALWALLRALSPTHTYLAMIAVALPAFTPLTTAKIRVGVEGILLRWLWTRRFLRHEEIETVERFLPYPWYDNAIVALRIVLSSGEEIRVPGNANTLELLEARIQEARKRTRKGDAAAVAPLLRRGDRSVGAWATALRSLGAGANAGPRTAPVPRERLFRVVEDPSLPATDRAAAAVALGLDLDDEDRARLRTAARATAMPGLRIAIEAAASGAEQAEVEAALAEVGEGEGPSARARV